MSPVIWRAVPAGLPAALADVKLSTEYEREFFSQLHSFKVNVATNITRLYP
jgi:hypothetical protein